jgi:hypothetical protein
LLIQLILAPLLGLCLELLANDLVLITSLFRWCCLQMILFRWLSPVHLAMPWDPKLLLIYI